MKAFRSRVLSNWNVMRGLRLVLGVWLLVMSVQSHDTAMIFLSAFLVLTASFGVGCCGVNGCYAPSRTNADKVADEVDYDEVK